MRRTMIAVLVTGLVLGGAGCATLFNNAPTAADKAERVLNLAQGAVQGIDLLAGMAGVDIFTVEEKNAFNVAMAETKSGLVKLTAVVESVIARHDADSLPEAEAVSADAAAILEPGH